MRVRTGRIVALSVLISILLVARSATPAEFRRDAGRERFVGRFWSQIRPNLNFQYGCNTGWHAFRFRSDGYFVYDGKIAGSWWIDHLGNVNALTTTGQKLLLFYDNHNRLSQRQQTGVTATSSFGTEYREYAECVT